MSQKYLIGVFDDEDKMIGAASELKSSNIPIHDIYTPFPMHIDHLLGIKRSRLPFVTLLAGATGTTVAITAQYWISAIDWPIIVGGKPFNSMPAFIPIGFELTILFGAFITAFAFFFRGKLAPKLKANIIHPRATQDRFIIALDAQKVEAQQIQNIMTNHGALETEFKEV